ISVYSNGTVTNVFDKFELRDLDLFQSRKQADCDVISASAARGRTQQTFEPVFNAAEPFIANDSHVIAPDLQELMIGFVGLCVTVCCREYQSGQIFRTFINVDPEFCCSVWPP